MKPASKRTTTLYFAYGSNLDPARMEKRVGSFQRRSPACTLPGWRLSFDKMSKSQKGSGFATIHNRDVNGIETQAIVEGAVYEVTEEQIAMLDTYEGVPIDYQRQELAVRTQPTNTLETAWVYIATSPSTTPLQPTWNYLAHLLRGVDLVSPTYYSQLQWAYPTLDTSVLFVYGSLRPDAGAQAGAPWTAAIAAKTVATRARLDGSRMYDDNYACVVLGSAALPDAPMNMLDRTILPSESVHGFALRPRVGVSLVDLLEETDAIEGYPTLYQRSDVPITTVENGVKHRAFVYHRPDCKKDVRVASGDWLQHRL